MTPATKARLLMPVADFADVAWLYGIRETEPNLMLTGRLTRVTVGRTAYYLRRDVDRLKGACVTAARDRLLALAYRALRFPHMSVDDEVAAASVLPVDGALLAFDDLCQCLADRDHDAAETVLDLLTGRLR
jgi:hypothetical protein